MTDAGETRRGGAWVERSMARDGTARLAGPAEVRVLSGAVVVTQSGDPLDHAVRAGEVLALGGHGRVVVWAVSESALAWRRGGASPRAGGSVRAALARLVRPGARVGRASPGSPARVA